MSTEIGRAVIRVDGDAAGLKAALDSSRTSLQSLKDYAKGVGEELGKSSTNYLRSLEKQAITLEHQAAIFGKSRAEIAAYNAAQLGVSQSAAQYISRIEAADKALQAQAAAARAAAAANSTLDASQRGLGMSAAATAAALRGVPAQFTDIITSLQGGQNPMTVFLQQGGQLKDMFGGAGAAARALGGYVLGLINPFTAAAAAAALLAAAYYKGSQEAEEYRKAIILTGNAAGTTSDGLAEMAKHVSSVAGTQGKAAEVLTQLTATGRIGSQAFESIANAAIGLERVSGTAVKNTVEQFVRLADEPAKASARLNETFHYLNQSTYERIAALEEQGKKEEAAALAQQTYADAVNKRVSDVKASLGYLEQAWGSITSAAKGAWDAMLDAGRPDTSNTAIAAAQKQLDYLEKKADSYRRRGAGTAAIDAAADALRNSISAQLADEQMARTAAANDAQRTQMQAAGLRATEAINKLIDSSATKQQKLNKELAEAKRQFDDIRRVNPSSDLLTSEQQVYANLRAKYADKGAPGRENLLGKASLQADLDAIQQTLKDRNRAYANADSILNAQRQAGLVTDRQYYEQRRVMLELDEAAQLRALSAQKEALEQQRFTGPNAARDEVVNREKIARIESEIGRVRDATATKAQILAIQEKSAQEALVRGYREAKAAAEDYLTTLERQGARQAAAVGQSDRERSFSAGRQQIEDRYTQQRRELENNKTLLELEGRYTEQSRQQYSQRLALTYEYQAKALESWSKSFADITAEESKWSNGARRAMQNYVDSASKSSDMMESLFTKAFSGLEDVVVKFATTGKLSITDFANSLIADWIRIEARTQFAKLLKGIGTSTGSGSGLSAVTDTALAIYGWSKGGMFGTAQAFAQGDIFERPTAFRYGQGGRSLGVMGEAGPEAIVPLKRGPNGSLGVASADAGRPSLVVQNNIQAGVQRNEVMQMVELGMKATESRLLERMARAGL